MALGSVAVNKVFSVIQRKVLMPNDFADLAELADCLTQF
jgi:hypothetical protein